MGVIIRNGIEYSGAGMGGGSCDCDEIVYLTQAEYDSLPDSKLTNGVEYRITDANTDSTKARNIAYDGSASGLEATSVQGAIDSVNESLMNLEDKAWKKAGETTSLNVFVQVPENAREIFAISMLNAEGHNYGFPIPVGIFSDFITGTSDSATRITYNSNGISVILSTWNTAHYFHKLVVYYR